MSLVIYAGYNKDGCSDTQEEVMKWNPVCVNGNSKQKKGPLQGTNMFLTTGDKQICDKRELFSC
jgi:hypothetical protein